MNILYLEDDKLYSETITEFLSENGNEVTTAFTGEEAISLSYNHSFDLLLLDINLPDMDGISFLKSLREIQLDTPAIFLTSYNDKNTLLKSFDVGANDYIKKPVDLDELLARINVYKKNNQIFTLSKQFSFDFQTNRLLQNGKDLNVSPKVSKLLSLLIEKKDKVVTNNEIEIELYSFDKASQGSIRVFINNLKAILGKDAISNIRGVGYRLESEKIS